MTFLVGVAVGMAVTAVVGWVWYEAREFTRYLDEEFR